MSKLPDALCFIWKGRFGSRFNCFDRSVLLGCRGKAYRGRGRSGTCFGVFLPDCSSPCSAQHSFEQAA
jgi:hypothetical protein